MGKNVATSELAFWLRRAAYLKTEAQIAADNGDHVVAQIYRNGVERAEHEAEQWRDFLRFTWAPGSISEQIR